MNCRVGVRPFGASLILSLMGFPVSVSPRLSAQTPSIQEFVHQVHAHGVPYDEAKRYSSSVAPVLLRMLEDQAETPHWTKIVGVLGIIGDESVVAPLVEFARTGDGVLTPDEYRAKSTVMIALGYVVNHTGSRVALDYLLSSVNPNIWNARGFLWISPFHSTAEQRDARLSSTSLLGLALSAAPEAGELLRSLAEGAGAPVQLAPSQAAAMRPFARDALREFDTVSSLGLSQYYAPRRQPDEHR